MIRITTVSELNFATQNPAFEIATQRVGGPKLQAQQCENSFIR